MIKISGGNLRGILSRFFSRINAPYRVTVINEESMSEALTIHLTKKTVYIFMSTFLVLIFLLLSALFLATPLRFYIPGNNNHVSRAKLIHLQLLSDSLEKINAIREQYIFNLIRVANGNFNTIQDTTMLTEKQIERSTEQNQNKIDHASKYNYLKNQVNDSVGSSKPMVKDTLQKNL